MYCTPAARIHSSCASRLRSNLAVSSAGTQKAGKVSISGLRLRFRANSELMFFFLILADQNFRASEIFCAEVRSVQPRTPEPQNLAVVDRVCVSYVKELAHVKRSGTRCGPRGA